jgi:peroxiredoxin
MGIKDDFLEMLCEVFPEATIYGTDSTYKIKENTKIKTFVLDQTNEQGVKKFIEEVNIKFDLIIDDGGHTMKQQQVPFGLLFKELKNGGVYIIEDYTRL